MAEPYKYGFFNALKIKDEDGRILGYDRTYNNEDMLSYLKGLISPFGVFKTVGNQCKPGMPDNDLPMYIQINTGKALINSYWIYITEPVLLQIPTPDINGVRKDKIVARWDEDARSVQLLIEAGAVSDYDPSDDIASVRSCQKSLPLSYDESKQDWDLENSLTPSQAEIVLGYVTVRPNASSIVENDIEVTVNSVICPWISRMIVTPTGQDELDLDRYLAWYRAAFENWFETVQDDLKIDLNIHHAQYGFKTGDPLPIVVPAKYGEDMINVHINGRVGVEQWDYWVENIDNANVKIHMVRMSGSVIPQSSDQSGSAAKLDNEIHVSVIKGSPMDFPDGSDIKY